MLIALPIVFYGLLWAGVARRRDQGLIDASLIAFVGLACVASISLELLTVFRAVVSSAIVGVWLLAIAGAGVHALQARRRHSEKPGLLARIKIALATHLFPDRVATAAVAAGLLLLALNLLVALVAPPNAWDGLTYHLPRVMHWLQNQSLAHYPTHILRQLWMNPFAEECILHAQSLAGSDRFANCVQWIAYLFGALAAAGVARKLGAGLRGQTFAWLFALSVPAVVLQASGPQTDVVTGMWLLIAGYATLGLLRPEQPLSRTGFLAQSAFVGAALGLACLTKGTSYIFGAGIAIALGAWMLKSLTNPTQRTRMFQAAAVIVVLFALLNGPFFARNIALFGKPFGPGVSTQQNATLSPAVTFSNLIRTAALQLAPPNDDATIAMGKAVIAIHETLGININNPGTSFESRPFGLYPMRFHEDITPNPIHLLAGALCCGIALAFASCRQNRAMLVWIVGILLGLLIYFTLIRWQSSSTRLLVPIYFGLAPIVGIVLGQIRFPRFAAGLLALCAVSGLYALTQSETRPLLARDGSSIFKGERANHYLVRLPPRASLIPKLLAPSRGHQFSTVGLICEEEDFEYLVWVGLAFFGHADARIEHVEVKNASKAAPMQNLLLQKVVVVSLPADPPK